MQFFTNPFQGLVVVQSNSSSPVTVIDDLGYQYVKDKNFVSSYNEFKQRDYNQLPGKLIKASEIKNVDVEFLSAKQLKESNRAAAEQDDEDDILAFDDREASTLNESMDHSQENVESPGYNRAKSVASLEVFDSQSSSASEVPSSFMDVETQPKNVFKVPSNKVHSSSRDYNNYKVNRSDTSSEEFDSRTLYSDSDLSTSTSSSVVNPKNKKKYL
ncbi:GSCOCT00000306001.2-RA-CDS [Cotesia congregata]|uniref:Cc_17a_1 n=1 Tax=Cotesia congregata TaxID=51543 RepID=D5GXL6_COTCN|nr:GSCOCT00000306001.2-RA-CDS [Cotesia congregata]CAG5088389.1 Cc_17a_1 [Cotesia congregata]CBL47422.1 hypothetical protein [Cotesia congregata]